MILPVVNRCFGMILNPTFLYFREHQTGPIISSQVSAHADLLTDLGQQTGENALGDGAPGRIRTSDPLVRSQVLYPAELRARNLLIFKSIPPKA